MPVTLVHIRVKPECIDGFIEVTADKHKHSIQETHNHRFDLLQDPNDPTRFIIINPVA